MTTKTREKPAEKVPEVEQPDFSSRVANSVLSHLGTPSDLAKVKATCVYGNAYRVNVYRNVNLRADLIISSSITDSFFVHVDDKGELVGANISKKYPLANHEQI